jgi:hypothetical protein
MDLESLRRVAYENRRHRDTLRGILAGAVARPAVAEAGKPAPTLESRYDEIFRSINAGSYAHRDPDYGPDRWTDTFMIGAAGPGIKLLMRFRWTEADGGPGDKPRADFLRAEFYEAPTDFKPVNWVMEGHRGTLIADEQLYRNELPEGSVSRANGARVEGYVSPEARLASLEQSLIHFTTARSFQQQPPADVAA